jgi:hypothetical protein
VILRKSRKNYEELKTHPCVDKVLFFFVGKYMTKTQKGLRMFKFTRRKYYSLEDKENKNASDTEKASGSCKHDYA